MKRSVVLLFQMMVFFGALFSARGGPKGPWVRAYELTLIVGGAAGCLVTYLLGWWKEPFPGQPAAAGKCPECGEPPPLVRKPKNRRQLLWGGWTCAKCGCEVDARGRKVEGG